MKDIPYKHALLNTAAIFDPFVQKMMNTPYTKGVVKYIFRHKTKYPARIYVFMNGQDWLQRNMRVSGCQGIPPFLTRPMNSEEIEYHHFDMRQTAYQYENWANFFEAELKEAMVLDRECPGLGTDFINKLKKFENRYAHFLLGKYKRDQPLNNQLELFT